MIFSPFFCRSCFFFFRSCLDFLRAIAIGKWLISTILIHSTYPVARYLAFFCINNSVVSALTKLSRSSWQNGTVALSFSIRYRLYSYIAFLVNFTSNNCYRWSLFDRSVQSTVSGTTRLGLSLHSYLSPFPNRLPNILSLKFNRNLGRWSNHYLSMDQKIPH